MDFLFSQEKKDLVLEGGDIKLIDSQEDLLAQRLFVRFKTFYKELFWNRSFGIDYINNVFGRARPKTSVDTIIKDEILKEPMVSDILSFSSSVSNYYYSCSFSVQLKSQETIVNFCILQNENGLALTTENGQKITARII